MCPRRTVHGEVKTCPSLTHDVGSGEVIDQELCWNSDHCQTSVLNFVMSLVELCCALTTVVQLQFCGIDTVTW